MPRKASECVCSAAFVADRDWRFAQFDCDIRAFPPVVAGLKALGARFAHKRTIANDGKSVYYWQTPITLETVRSGLPTVKIVAAAPAPSPVPPKVETVQTVSPTRTRRAVKADNAPAPVSKPETKPTPAILREMLDVDGVLIRETKAAIDAGAPWSVAELTAGLEYEQTHKNRPHVLAHLRNLRDAQTKANAPAPILPETKPETKQTAKRAAKRETAPTNGAAAPTNGAAAPANVPPVSTSELLATMAAAMRAMSDALDKLSRSSLAA